MEHHVVECSYDEPLSEADDKAAAAVVDQYLEANGGHWVRSYYSKDRTRMICDIEAPDAKIVRQAFFEAKIPVDAVYPAILYEKEMANQPAR